jgi:DNA-binding beta-propeller fold protein YncE
MDLNTRRVFSVCGNKAMAVINADTGKLVTTVPIGDGADAVAFDPATGLIFSSNGEDGTLTIVHEDSADKYTVVENVPTQKGARTMALDPHTHAVYVVTAKFGPMPEATKETPHPRPPRLPNSFVILVVAK